MLTLPKVHFQNALNILINFSCCHGSSYSHRVRLSRLHSAILVILIIQLCNTVNLAYKGQKNCNRTRSVLTEMSGMISDGPDDYLKESHCEWIIQAPSVDYFIMLNITSMDTECSYDHLYIYDGASYDSQLLAVFSGESTPSPVIAKSGAMLILLYSDTNYMRAGFEAEYSITECPLDCSSRGQCLNHQCQCDEFHTGTGCEIELCPENCGVGVGRGNCIESSNQGNKYCLCHNGFSGDGCSLEDRPQKGDTWHWIHRNGHLFHPRTSHGTVFFPQSDRMFVFGGYDLNVVLDDLFVYSFSDGSWTNLKEERQSHTSRKRRIHSHLRKEVSQPLKFFPDHHHHHQSEAPQKAREVVASRALTFSVNSNNTVSVKLAGASPSVPDHSPSSAHHRRAPRMIPPRKDLKYKRQRKQVVWPQPRFGHCMASFGTDFVSYGGKLASGKVSSELWLYNTSLKQWNLVSDSSMSSSSEKRSSSHFPPALVYCTLTFVDEEWLYLFGGALSHGGFSNAMYRINPFRGWMWEKVETFGGNPLKARLVGHTTVFHAQTRSLYIYGGIKVNIARFSKLSDQLLVFNIDKHYWSEIHYPKGAGDNEYSSTGQYSPAPLERAFHSSLVAGNYMVVHGGYMHKHKEEEACYDRKIYLFHLKCHIWLSPQLTPSQDADGNPRSEGVYGHSTFLRHGNTVVVTGGFHGTVSNHVVAYVLPSSLIAAEGTNFDVDKACQGHKTQSLCVSNLGCGWCPVDERCYDRTRSANCTTNLQTSTCPELCPALDTCQSCVAQGGRDACGWCVRSRACLQREPAAVVQRSCGGPAHQGGWWGARDRLITNMEDCVTRDVPSGLTFMQFKGPVNYSQPDYVGIISDVGKDLRKPGDMREPQELQTVSPSEFRLKGFLHPTHMEYMPLNNKLYGPDMEPIRLVLQGYKLNATLRLSTDDSVSNLKKVASLISGKIATSEATRPDGDSLIPGAGRLLLQLDMIPLDLSSNSSFNLSLLWSLGLNHPSPLSAQHLEPFGEGGSSCTNHSSCLACLSDYMCGWCAALRTCIPRNGSLLGPVAPCGPQHLPVTDTRQCEQCEDFIYCDDCVQTGYCEWLVEKAHCTRRGRYAAAVRQADSCPVPCHERSTCAACLGEPGLCAWCEASKECFLFSLYTSVYQYGACRVWIDEDHTNLTSIHLSVKFISSLGAASPGTFQNSTHISSLFKDDLGECQICESHTSCGSCLAALGCGWCFSDFNPTIGLCTSGNFSQPHKGECSVLMENIPVDWTKNLSRVVAQHKGISWTYSSCPDVDECKLNLHNCHPNATCVNTDGGFNCSCPRGFAGNGRSTCQRTCYETCVHGKCSGSPDFVCECNLGWTGADCSINCGCNNHSKCQKVGVCDHCQGETTGDSCELCRPGSYGNATTIGCQKCECNGHWDEAMGRCNQTTGKCFCTHNTEGHKCDKCREGFYGDPRNGGRCYRQCTARGITINATNGFFGTQKSARHPLDTCLWILSAHDSINPHIGKLQGSHVLQVTIETIDINCEESSLYIYEGLPDFLSVNLSWDRQNLVGTFCTGHSSNPIITEAQSGVMTIFYEKSATGQQGFTASYEVLQCPDNPGKNRVCLLGKPVCNEGWRGVRCDVPVCPNKCSEGRGRGRCDPIYGRCICNKEFVGEDCSITKQDHLVVLQELFNPLKISSSLSHLQTVLPRFGHTAIVDHQGSLWVFGGYSLSRGPLNDIQQFDTRNKTWVQVTVNVYPGSQPPSQRYLHASAYVVSHNQMFVYGGMNKTHFLGDFWKFSIGTESWTMVADVNLPPMAGHTLTCRGETSPQSLVLIGGVSAEYGLLEDVWEFDLIMYTWQKTASSGAKPIGIFGHSTVYHESTLSFYVYGGYSFRNNELSLNPFLYVFDYASKRWSVLPPDGKINHNPASRPAPRAFHTAVTTDEYMVLIGGYISDRLNSNQDLLVYSYKCNMWIPLNNRFITVAGHQLSPPLLGVSSAIYESSIYLIGGFSGTVHGSVVEITIPQDLCTLNLNKSQCKDRIGCANCVVYNSSGTNTSYCYSHTQPEPSSCLRPAGKRTNFNGIKCDAAILEERECYQYKTCAECLAYWPAHKDAKQQCQWCLTCPKGKCIPKFNNCSSEVSCQTNSKYSVGPSRTTDVSKCPELSCAASDCEKCIDLGCTWAQQVRKAVSKGAPEKNSSKPLCLKHSSRNGSMEENGLISFNDCPNRCHFHRTCKACLQFDSVEQGVSECHWSPTFRKCISPISVALQCLGGTCGLLLSHSEHCPPPCTTYTQCDQCLSQAQCGWCAVDTSIGGLGICTEGRLEEPRRGRCRDLSYESVARNETLMILHGLRGKSLTYSIQNGSRFVSWHYGRCPPENECKNHHHTCNAVKEVCVDRDEGYACNCASGYSMNEDSGLCRPVCTQGCKHGTCIEPNNCSCDFGFVGDDCSIKCQCNGHSDCAGPDKLTTCLKCHNNTMGQQCQRCKPNFVGNPEINDKCKSCRDYCYGHTDICTSDNVLRSLNVSEGENVSEAALLKAHREEEEPLTNASCYKCGNMTEGPRCGTCLPGYFRGTTNRSAPCRPCQCNGHGSICDAEWGNYCNCQNNTETPCNGRMREGVPGGKEEEKDCWKRQCSKCKEMYFGNPTDGHQCYRQMTLEVEYCLDPITLNECQSDPSPLPRGRVVLFAVQPKFNNVDIRLFLDISRGGVDAFFTTFPEGFVISVNNTNWYHQVEVDPDYPVVENLPTPPPPPPISLERTKLLSPRYDVYFNTYSAQPLVSNRNVTPLGSPRYLKHTIKADGLKTYFTLSDSNHFLVVKNLTDRLVVTLPKQNHNLSQAKFYVVLFGVGGSGDEGDDGNSFGAIYFRQDQPRIDLFVFFSVFFSCFFLFLAVCVVVWKVKQGVDQRRARRRQVVEMLHMAKRPFSSATLVLHASEPCPVGGGLIDAPAADPGVWSPARRKRGQKREKTFDRFEIGPVAVEPTDDGVAAVVTIVIQLPGVSIGGVHGGLHGGNNSPPQRLALGSSLCLVSRIYPPTSRPFHLRRRTSHLAM